VKFFLNDQLPKGIGFPYSRFFSVEVDSDGVVGLFPVPPSSRAPAEPFPFSFYAFSSSVEKCQGFVDVAGLFFSS